MLTALLLAGLTSLCVSWDDPRPDWDLDEGEGEFSGNADARSSNPGPFLHLPLTSLPRTRQCRMRRASSCALDNSLAPDYPRAQTWQQVRRNRRFRSFLHRRRTFPPSPHRRHRRQGHAPQYLPTPTYLQPPILAFRHWNSLLHGRLAAEPRGPVAQVDGGDRNGDLLLLPDAAAFPGPKKLFETRGGSIAARSLGGSRRGPDEDGGEEGGGEAEDFCGVDRGVAGHSVRRCRAFVRSSSSSSSSPSERVSRK